MVRRACPVANAREPVFGSPATTSEEAFVRFGDACHRTLADHGPELSSNPQALLDAALGRMPRAERRLVADFITELTGGTHTFVEACALWQRSQNDTIWMRWHGAGAYLRFLVRVRDTIDPNAWPDAAPRFRQEPARVQRAR